MVVWQGSAGDRPPYADRPIAGNFLRLGKCFNDIDASKHSKFSKKVLTNVMTGYRIMDI
jgi:hypothetical protein